MSHPYGIQCSSLWCGLSFFGCTQSPGGLCQRMVHRAHWWVASQAPMPQMGVACAPVVSLCSTIPPQWVCRPHMGSSARHSTPLPLGAPPRVVGLASRARASNFVSGWPCHVHPHATPCTPTKYGGTSLLLLCVGHLPKRGKSPHP